MYVLCAICVGINRRPQRALPIVCVEQITFHFLQPHQADLFFEPKEKPTYVQQITVNRLLCVSLLLFHAAERQMS